jgi:hypothetical protein
MGEEIGFSGGLNLQGIFGDLPISTLDFRRIDQKYVVYLHNETENCVTLQALLTTMLCHMFVFQIAVADPPKDPKDDSGSDACAREVGIGLVIASAS